ncbi:MAG: DUF4440 domain-containing protein [Pirellulaceae bacterium]
MNWKSWNRSFLVSSLVLGLCGNSVMAQQAPPQTIPPAVAGQAPATAATATAAPATAQEPPQTRELTVLEKEIVAATEKLVAAFNEGSAEKVVGMFTPKGELIDENGVVHTGDELKAVLTEFFKAYPQAKTGVEIDSVRELGEVTISEGTRVVATKDETSVAVMRYQAIWDKTEKGFQLASLRDYAEPQPLAPREALESLSWLVGDWVNEGDDGKVEFSYKWSEDGNFLLGDILIKQDGQVTRKTSQRIGWDANEGQLRSWNFESDGGFGQSLWTPTDEGWVLHSAATGPDGTEARATITMIPTENGRYVVKGSDRMVGDVMEPDFEYIVAKKPPAPAAAGN